MASGALLPIANNLLRLLICLCRNFFISIFTKATQSVKVELQLGSFGIDLIINAREGSVSCFLVQKSVIRRPQCHL